MLGEEAVELLFDHRGLRRLRSERLDVTLALQVARGGQQVEMQAFETLLLTQHTATAEPGEHARVFAAVSTLDAPRRLSVANLLSSLVAMVSFGCWDPTAHARSRPGCATCHVWIDAHGHGEDFAVRWS